jgi:hypothetical protein
VNTVERQPPRPAALLLGLALLAGALRLGRPLAPFDEGFLLVGAERLLHGELPYRDFYALYPPGQYAVVALLFSLFGVEALVLRLYCLAVRAVVAWLVYRITHRLAGPAAAIAAWAGAVAWSGAIGDFGLTTYPALALVLAALLRLLAAADGEPASATTRRALVTGAALLALAAFVRHDLAAYGLFASLPLLREAARRGGWRLVARRFASPLAAAFAALAVPLLALAPWSALAFELFVYPATSYSAMRGLPYPPLAAMPPPFAALGVLRGLAAATPGVPFLMPPVFALALLLITFRQRPPGARGDADRTARSGVLAIAALALLAANLARVRSDLMHAAPSVVVGFAVGAILVERLLRERGRLRLAVAAVAAGLAAQTALPAVAVLASSPPGQLRPGAIAAADPARASNLYAGAAAREVASWLRENAPPDERIFVGCGRHDRIFANEPILYTLSGRLPGTRYHALDPGVATTASAQAEIVGELERHRVRFVVLSTRFDGRREPNGSARSSGVRQLDEALRERYRPVAEFRPWYVVLRRTAPWTSGDAPAAAER